MLAALVAVVLGAVNASAQHSTAAGRADTTVIRPAWSESYAERRVVAVMRIPASGNVLSFAEAEVERARRNVAQCHANGMTDKFCSQLDSKVLAAEAQLETLRAGFKAVRADCVGSGTPIRSYLFRSFRCAVIFSGYDFAPESGLVHLAPQYFRGRYLVSVLTKTNFRYTLI